jgi:hypothetical protein
MEDMAEEDGVEAMEVLTRIRPPSAQNCSSQLHISSRDYSPLSLASGIEKAEGFVFPFLSFSSGCLYLYTLAVVSETADSN